MKEMSYVHSFAKARPPLDILEHVIIQISIAYGRMTFSRPDGYSACRTHDAYSSRIAVTISRFIYSPPHIILHPSSFIIHTAIPPVRISKVPSSKTPKPIVQNPSVQVSIFLPPTCGEQGTGFRSAGCARDRSRAGAARRRSRRDTGRCGRRRSPRTEKREHRYTWHWHVAVAFLHP